MRTKKWLKRKLAGVVAVSLLLSCVGVVSVPERKSHAQVTAKTIEGLGTGPIATPDSTNGGGWSYVYYGKYNGSPVKYRVLDPNSTAFGAKDPDNDVAVSNTMFLDCDTILETMLFDHDASREDFVHPNVWQGSDIQLWLKGNDFLGSTDCFSTIENKAIVKSNKTFTEGEKTHCKYSDSHEFDLDNTGLSDDRIFLLDITEASNAAYGYKSPLEEDSNRVKTDGSREWWLRSPCSGKEYDVGGVYSNGKLNDFHVSNYGGRVSPAFNVNLSSVIFSSLISGTAGAAGAEYKLTLKDADMNATVQSGKSANRVGNQVTIPFTITNYIDNTDSTKSRKANRVSVLITDKAWTASGASILQYGELTTDLDFASAGATASGTGSFTLNTSKVMGTWGTDYHVYILAENANSWETDTGKRTTDYASIPVEIHAHDFTYSGSGSVITAMCGATGCSLTDNKTTLTIQKPTLAKQGAAGDASATLENLTAFNAATGLTVAASSIKYIGRGTTSYAESATAPMVEGAYRAQITIDGVTTSEGTGKSVTASVDYEVAAPDAPAPAPTSAPYVPSYTTPYTPPYTAPDSQPILPGGGSWNTLSSVIEAIPAGGSLNINMNGSITLPMTATDAIKGKDVNLVLNMGNGIKWTVNGKDIAGTSGDVYLGVYLGTTGIPVDVINRLTGEREKMNFMLSRDGGLGFAATLTLPLKKTWAGLVANLFNYNRITKDMDFVSSGQIGADGSADLVIGDKKTPAKAAALKKQSIAEFIKLAAVDEMSQASSFYTIVVDDHSLDPNATPELTPTPSTEPTPTAEPTTTPATSAAITLSASSKDGKINLSWNKLKKVKKYRVYQKVDGKNRLFKETKKTSLTIDKAYVKGKKKKKKMKIGKKYTFSVRAYVNGKWTKITKASTKTVKVKK